MDKARVVERYKALLVELNEDAPDVILSGNAALVVLGVEQEVENILAGIRPSFYHYISTKQGDEAVETVVHDLEVTLNAHDIYAGVVCVNGIWTHSPSELLRWKRALVKARVQTPEEETAWLEQERQLELIIKERRYTARIIA